MSLSSEEELETDEGSSTCISSDDEENVYEDDEYEGIGESESNLGEEEERESEEEEEERNESEEEEDDETDQEIRDLFRVSDYEEEGSEEEEDEEGSFSSDGETLERIDRQVEVWLERMNQEMKKYLAELKEIVVPLGSPWYRRDSVLFYKAVMDLALKVSNAIKLAMDVDQVRLDTETLKDLYFHFYGLMVRHTKPMCAALPGKDDQISTAPIYYFFYATCYLLVYVHESGALNAELFERSADSSKYCTEHTLFINKGIAIENYNVEMLCRALHQLEMFWRVLPVHRELHQYLAALELGFAYLLCYTHDENVHNVASLRIGAGETGEYYPSKELVFEMAVRFTALYEEIGSTVEIQKYVVKPTGMMKLMWPSDRDVERAKLALIAEAKKVHSDSYTDSVRKIRQSMAIYPSECYLFFKENPTVQELEPQSVFDTFRPDVAWRDLCDNYANVRPDEMIRRCEDPLGVRVALPLLLNIICNQDLKRMWEDFFTPSPAFLTGNSAVLVTSLLRNSKSFPLYVTCMNDAYVVYGKKFYCFGSSCESYIQALVFWINIVQYCCDAQVGSTPFRDFYMTVMGGECQNEILVPPDTIVPFFEDDMDDGPDAMTTDTSRVVCLISEAIFFGSETSEDEEEEDDEDSGTATDSSDSDSSEDDGNWGDILF